LPARLDELEEARGRGVLTWHARDRAARALSVWRVDAEDHRRWKEFRETLQRDLLAEQRPDGGWACEGGPKDAYAAAVACRLLALGE
ncbi:MAG: hypothetical protein O2816_18480, partial [Planctomycetota bacterium]|nr:hypothetical protein [Planctomycetota bacterium]